uniref:histone-lysine N-methyltransferase, H3 lysine-9 specific SUVH4-like isoform X2 n=1 Tax=Erigeron canadensis TaxID=72917 RepID=UPI001CB9A3B8|nr:histone-lysine N-methyltransferase, H3 lysine-9 specific SUVH4-like isoform X2 [Erigeron canadensis]
MKWGCSAVPAVVGKAEMSIIIKMGNGKCLAENGNEALDVSVTKNFGQRVQKSPVKKRCSPRFRDIPDAKKPYYGPHHHHHHRKQLSPIPVTTTITTTTRDTPTPIVLDDDDDDDVVVVVVSDHTDPGDGGLNSSPSSYVVHTRLDKARVKKTLRIYNQHYLQFVQELNACENRPPKPKQKGVSSETGAKRTSKRPDLKAIAKMKENNQVLFPTKRFGHLPGIDVGYQFYSRAEMVALGLHSHWFTGIDYIGESCKKTELKGYTFPLAIAIVLSGQYEDDQDNLDDIVYTGEGGNDINGSKHQIKDQELLRGNMALKNSMEQSIPVRVIRGHTDDRHFKLYTYDGLYKVSEYWPAQGTSGFVVYKYRLKRLDGQPKLTGNQVQYSNGRSSRVSIKAPQLVCLDITEGQEDMHIPAINTIDDATITGFAYTKYNQVLGNLKLPPNANGCECKGSCTNPRTCACARLNGSAFPYVRNNGGRLIEAKDVVFECGPECGCGPGCVNRISQRGIKYRLEVFRTSNRGWAVKTKDFIPSGAPVCEYIGELRRTNELDNVAENDYIFEIDCWQTMKGVGGRERRLGDVSVSVSKELENAAADEKEPEFCIDAGRIGNVARFINHSCDPNLFVQCVLSSHHDVKLARIVLFAADNIPPFQELTYDYGYALDSVVDNNGTVRMLPCHCGTTECRNRLY